ncbi:tetratricopeptide repeat protein 36-like, partial [Limulus polyphemus]|uniref:Tetratricopeptide repeat protein 36-like n=1 Tax=Limulus polyphemus TaxID=6850 RepID=A0ABM1BZ32_LIMPO
MDDIHHQLHSIFDTSADSMKVCYDKRSTAVTFVPGDMVWLYIPRRAISDLNNAINLSEGKGKAACQAYCQRALIHCLHKDDERALEDFKIAAALGSEFAKAQVVRMNPYAALCNQMLSKVIDNLQR